MRFGFVTCVHLGLSCMEAIYDVGSEIALAVTLNDDQAARKSGRIYLDAFCQSRDIPLLKAANVNDASVIEAVRARQIDWLFIIGWSQIARRPLFEACRFGALGMHPTLLPQGRGRAAIPWAILKRLHRTGVTLFQIDDGVDTGPILDQVIVPLTPHIDATELYARIEAAHVHLMRAAVPKLNSGTLVTRAQDERDATEWPGRRPEDGCINLAGSVADAECLVRAVTRPYPGAFFIKNGRKTIVWKARVLAQDATTSGAPLLEFYDGRLECLETEDAGAVPRG